MAFYPIGVVSILYMLILCIQANSEFLDLQIHEQNDTILLGQTLDMESGKEAPEYEIVQLRVISQRTADEQNVIRVHLAAFGKDIHLRLERNDDFDDRSKRVKFSRGSLTDSGVQLTEINVEDDDPGMPYIDIAEMTAVTIRYGSDGELLMDGVIGDDFVIKPALIDKYSGDSIAYDWDFSDDKSDFDVYSTPAPKKSYHVVYRNKRNLKSFKVMDDFNRTDAFQYYKSSPNRPLHVFPEVLLMVDYDSYAAHVSRGLNDAQIKRYYVSFMNGVDLRFRIFSDPKISLILSQIVIFKSRYDTPFLTKYRGHWGTDKVDAAIVLREVMRHMYKYREDYPDIDVVVQLTNLDICGVQEWLFFVPLSCESELIGISELGGACRIYHKEKSWRGVTLVEDNGGFVGVVPTAHEIGHMLGSLHDGDLVKNLPNDYSNCRGEDGYIMTSMLSKTQSLQWSECSIKQIKWFLNSYEASCLYNRPSYRNELVGSDFPGALLSLDEQCRLIYGTRANAWDSRVCIKLQCDLPARNKEFVFPPAAEGSSCGINLYCRDGKCVPKPQTYSRAWSMTPVHNIWENIDSTTVSTITKLPRTTIKTVVTTTKLPRRTVTRVRTTTKLPRRTVTRVRTTTKLPRRLVTRVSTTRLPWRTATRVGTTTKLPRTTVSKIGFETILPRITVKTVGTTTKLPRKTVTRVGTTTKLPWRTVTAVRTTTGLPGAKGNEACRGKKEEEFCKIYFRIIGPEVCRYERLLEDCCYSYAMFCKV